MIKPEQIPPEAYAAAAELLAEGCRTDQAIAAALSAWPGMHGVIYAVGGNQIILPLPPQENSDDQ